MPDAPRFAPCLTLVLLMMTGTAARGQDAPLFLQGIVPGGVRTSATESWGTFTFTVTNPNPVGRAARILVFYPERPDVQFGRDVSVPAESSLSAWLPVGPAPKQTPQFGRNVESLLYDRTAGQDRLLLPRTEERARSRAVLYRLREPTTAFLFDDADTSTGEPGDLIRPDSPASQALMLARVLRQAGDLSESVSVVPGRFLPPMPEAFDGIDHFVLAGNRLAADPPGLEALRRWVQHGGKLWVMLDLVEPQVVAALLGEDVDFQVVDRVGLTTVQLLRLKGDPVAVAARDLEQPVDLVRVLPSEADRVLHTVNGWPASFTRQVGRGKVLFTTLGPRGWHRPRTILDPASPFPTVPELPVPFLALAELAAELRPRFATHPFTAENLRPLLNEEIGYTVIERRTVAAILGAFVLALIVLGIGLRRSRRPELVGGLGPAAAVMAAGLFLVLGEASRQAVPPTIAVAELVDPVLGTGEAAVNGLFAVYRPDSGLAQIGARRGAVLDLDAAGLEGQTRRRVQTEADAWHWDQLALPAGVRSGPFRATARTGRMTAVARFGPDGIEGRLDAGDFRNPADAIIIGPAREPVAVRLAAGGSFVVRTADALAAGQFLAGTVLTDRQQRRQTVYRQLLTGPWPEHMEGRDLLLAWAEPPEIPFTAAEGARTVGTALLMIPLEFERPAAGVRVTVLPAFLPYRRVAEGGLGQPTLDATTPVDMRLRFQLPASVLPLTVERVTFVARAKTPGWRFSVAGYADGKLVPLHSADSPVEPVRVEIADPRVLQLDPQGGLHLNVAVGNGGAAGLDTRWKIESMTLEIVGRTGERR